MFSYFLGKYIIKSALLKHSGEQSDLDPSNTQTMFNVIGSNTQDQNNNLLNFANNDLVKNVDTPEFGESISKKVNPDYVKGIQAGAGNKVNNMLGNNFFGSFLLKKSNSNFLYDYNAGKSLGEKFTNTAKAISNPISNSITNNGFEGVFANSGMSDFGKNMAQWFMGGKGGVKLLSQNAQDRINEFKNKQPGQPEQSQPQTPQTPQTPQPTQPVQTQQERPPHTSGVSDDNDLSNGEFGEGF